MRRLVAENHHQRRSKITMGDAVRERDHSKLR